MNQMSRLFASLSVLSIDPKMDTFSERKRVQKLVYLLDKVFGLDFGFRYNWYLHGPYSPTVTETIFDVVERGQIVETSPDVLSVADYRNIERMKSFLGKDIDSNDRLELLVSLHFLMQRAKAKGVSQKDVIAFLKVKKPYFTDKEILEAIDRLQTLKD